MIPKIVKNLIYSIVVPIVMLFLGLNIVFLIMQLVPGDPVLAHLPTSFTQEQYDTMKEFLGFNQPLIIQFLRFISDTITWNWGISGTISKGAYVFELVMPRISTSFIFAILPISLGILVGIVLGVISVKIRNKFIKILFQIGIILGISTPVFYVGLNQLFIAYSLSISIYGNPIIPGITLFLITAMLMTRQFRSNFIDTKERHDIASNIVKYCLNINLIFMATLLLEITFGLHGFGDLFLSALMLADYYVIRTVLVIILFLTILPLLVAGLVFTFYSFFVEDKKLKPLMYITDSEEQYFEETDRSKTTFGKDLKDFAIRRLKSPFTLIGLLIVGFAIVISILPIILTPLTFEEILGVYAGSYDPPSPSHPLGQTKFGRDVLALLVYGIRFSLILGIFPILIAILGGVLFAYISKFHNIVKMAVLAVLMLGFLLPTFALLIVFYVIGLDALNMYIVGILLIPGFTIVFNKTEFKLRNLIKSALIYLPLFMGFTILLFEGLSFTGFSDPFIPQIGGNISDARMHLYNAPWASLWPGFALMMLCIGFFALHYGLKEPITFSFKRKME